ncbi:MAG: anti-sigma factor domain-containing protein, partial [Firmicutes bacterium]|nr:anti-sigma factor domain-containing protein [Bacillota bacterium]
METRGMVVKLKRKSCIVVTPDGDYREVPLPKDAAARVGQEISLPMKRSFSYFRQVIVAASLLICVFAGQFYLGQTPPAAAYLTIDINPSIELGVSAERKVVEARGLNGDGEKILAEVKIKGRQLHEAVELIVSQAVVDQYLKKEDENVILATLTVENGQEPLVDLDSVYEAIKKPVDSGGVDSEVIIEPVEPEMRKEAERSGVSTGRYLLLQKSGKKGVPVSVSEVTSRSLGELEKEKKVSFIEVLGEDNHNHGMGSNENRGGIKAGKATQDAIRGIYVERRKEKDDEPEVRTAVSGKKQQGDDGGKAAAKPREVKKTKDVRATF